MVESINSAKFFKLIIPRSDLKKVFTGMSNALEKATANSLNVIGRKGNKEIKEDIKSEYNIKSRSITRRVSLRRADSRSGAPFVISVLKKGRGLFLYSAKRTKKGVSVRVKKSRKMLRSGFIIRVASNNAQFVARKSKKGGTVMRRTRLGTPYKAPRSDFLYGPSVAQLYKRRRSRAVLENVINRDYEKELNKQFNNQFEKIPK